MTAEMQKLVATPEFQRVFRMASRDKQSLPYRALKCLERVARGTTKKQESAEALDARHMKASGSAPRQSQKETGDGISEHLST